jgi:cell wall-active antibiotic response 4TMS protein YvqF
MATRCNCQRCSIRGLMGPAILITIGVLFLVQQSHWAYHFGRTWPVILLVIGGVKLAEALASDAGHNAQQAPPPYPPPMPPQGPGTSSQQGSQQGQGPGQVPPPPPLG